MFVSSTAVSGPTVYSKPEVESEHGTKPHDLLVLKLGVTETVKPASRTAAASVCEEGICFELAATNRSRLMASFLVPNY